MNFITKALIVGSIIIVTVFFSVQVQRILLAIAQRIARGMGKKVQEYESSIQRYIFTNADSVIAKVYNWLNRQVIALGLKKSNVTPLGFLLFWCIVALPLSVIVSYIMKSNIGLSIIIYIIVIVIMLFITAVRTASTVVDREECVMTAVDMIIPEIHNGVHNAVLKYVDKIPETIRGDFTNFLQRIERGMSFSRSMIILSDNIGCYVFTDFARKAIYFEETGEKDGVDIFLQIVRRNKLRRTLRYEAKKTFDSLKKDLLLSLLVVWIYAFFVGFKESYTRHFFLETTFGQILFIFDIVIEVFALGYIVSIRARDL